MALAGLLAAAVVVELGFRVILVTPLRWVLPVPIVALYGPDHFTGYRHRPNVSGLWPVERRSFVRTSNLGLRDRDRELVRGDGPRAIVIGNSYIEALQVDQTQTASAVAEALLARIRPGAEVINLGLAGARAAVEVARLQSQGLALRPDLAVVLLESDDLLSPPATDENEATTYRRRADGEFELSYDFRNTFGYRLRTSKLGQLHYWLLDRSQLARVVNARRNFGVMFEWPRNAPAFDLSPSFGAAAEPHCSTGLLERLSALWIGGEPADRAAYLRAFVRDLAAVSQSHSLPIVVATHGIETRCAALSAKRAELTDTIRARLRSSGLGHLDVDAEAMAMVGAEGMARLRGFGQRLGFGHLNVEGNRVYGEILAKTIGAALGRP
jgi:hypothetical protein